jgi:protein-histidine pros-kinase
MEERRPVVFEYHDPTIDRWFEKRACPSPDGVAALTVDVTTRRLAQKLEAAKYAVTRALASSPRLADASESVLRHLCAAVDAQVGCFWQKTPDGELLELAHAYAEPDPAAPDRFAEFLAFTRSRRHPPGGSLPGRVWIARKVTWIPDLSADPDFTRGPLAAAAGLVGGIGVPVSIDDDLVGVIELFLPRRPAPSEAAFRTLGAAGSEISQFIRRRLAEADQQRLSAIVHSSHDAIVGISPERLVTSWNRGAERLYGLSAADIIGHEITRLVPADHLAEFDALFSRVLRGERIDPFDTVRLRHDGSLVDISLSWSPIHADDGSIAGISSIARDITAQKRAELVERHNRELQEENRRALEANRLKSDFLASMSHELRTPLHGVIGFSEFLVDEKVGPLNPTQKEFLNDVLNSGRHLLRLINNILDLSKIEAGRLELFPELLHLADLVQEVCAILRPLAEQHQVALRFDPDTARFDVLLDPLRLRQILYNLLSNAVQYNRPGGLATLEILRLPSPTRLQFTVVDDGPGIAPEDHARIFEEFRQLGAPRSQSTGLGLAVTRRLVECMGGEITVASQPGRGSRFTVRLPLPPPPAPPPSS